MGTKLLLLFANHLSVHPSERENLRLNGQTLENYVQTILKLDQGLRLMPDSVPLDLNERLLESAT